MRAASPAKSKASAAGGRSRRVLWTVLVLSLGLLAGAVVRSNSRATAGLHPAQQRAKSSAGAGSDAEIMAVAERAMLDAVTDKEGPDERELLDMELAGQIAGGSGDGSSTSSGSARSGEAGGSSSGESGAADSGAAGWQDSQRASSPAAEESAAAGPSARLPKADESRAAGGSAAGQQETDAAESDGTDARQPSSPQSELEDSVDAEEIGPADGSGGSSEPDPNSAAADTFPAEKMQKLGREADAVRFAAQLAEADKQAHAAASGSQQPGAQAAPASSAGGGGAAGQQATATGNAAAAKQDQIQQLELKVIEERQLDTGIIHYGDLARVRSFMHKLVNSQPVHVAVVGGSISAGLGDEGFGPEVFRRITAAFPHPGHRFHNGALGGVMSTYMNSCLKWHVPSDIDLILVEFNVNDGFEPEYCAELPCKVEYGGLNTVLRRAYERLLRKLLMLPRRPAVILLQTFDYSTNLFMNSGEDQLGVFAQLYSLPWLSFRGVVWKRQQRGAPGYSVPELMLEGGGDKHPRPYGHQMLADLATGLLRRVGEGMVARPFTPQDQAIVDEDLLDPVLPGNIVWDEEYCIIDDKFREKVSDAPGFEWVDEAQPHHLTHKWGFVATKPGSHLVITINTAETTKSEVPDPHTVVTINHLKSYEHMGRAEVACISGCRCQPSIIDGHWEQRNSQLSMHRISVSQAKQCTLKITVLDSTSSGEHKVKVQGLVVSDEASAAGEFMTLMPQIIPADLMGAARLESN